MPHLIDHQTLQKWLTDHENMMIFDASWYGPGQALYAEQEFIKRHIPGARFFDLSQFQNSSHGLPHMFVCDPFYLSQQLTRLDISLETPCKIIFYDNSDYHSSCRAFWILKMVGYPLDQLYVLNGTLDMWEAHHGPIARGVSDNQDHDQPLKNAPQIGTVCLQMQYLRTLAQMKANICYPTEQVIDLRHAVDYVSGPQQMRHASLRSGHFPGSFSFPFSTMFTANGLWKPLELICKQLVGIGIELSLPMVTLCGSGITAATLNIVLDHLQHPKHALYDGSWAEWGANVLYPGERTIEERPVQTSV